MAMGKARGMSMFPFWEMQENRHDAPASLQNAHSCECNTQGKNYILLPTCNITRMSGRQAQSFRQCLVHLLLFSTHITLLLQVKNFNSLLALHLSLLPFSILNTALRPDNSPMCYKAMSAAFYTFPLFPRLPARNTGQSQCADFHL